MIEVKGVTKRIGRKKVLDDVSFNVHKGEITCLIGLNGAGKTTMMNAIMNLTTISKGTILLDGHPLTQKDYNQITFIPDATIMLPHMTIQEAMAFMKDYYTNWNSARAKELLDFFRLKPEDKIADLSKGNAAKANLLMGLALDVEYLLMDEPFSGIDLFSREQIAEVFTTHLVEDRGVLITTHEIGDIEHLIDRVILLEDGAVYKDFRSEDVRENEGKSVIDVLREAYQA